MNAFWQELKMTWRAALVWTVLLVGLVCMYVALYPTFSSDIAATKSIFAQIPPVVTAALNIDIATILSFLGFFAFTLTELALAAGMYAMFLGVTILSREARSKTTDFLLSRPKGRTAIFFQKFFAGFVVLVVSWLVVFGASFGLAKAFGANEFNVNNFSMLFVAIFCIQLWFYVFGFFVAQMMRRLKSVISVTLAVTFGFFVLGTLEPLLKEPVIRYFSPFRFFNFVDIAAGKGFEAPFLVTAMVSLLVFTGISFVLYKKRDIRAAA